MKTRKLASLALAGTLMTASAVATSSDAEAYSRRGIGAGIAAGVIAGTVLGAYAYGVPRYPRAYTYHSYASGPTCYQGPRQCDWTGRHCWISRFGERVCSGGEWRCWRPSICD